MEQLPEPRPETVTAYMLWGETKETLNDYFCEHFQTRDLSKTELVEGGLKWLLEISEAKKEKVHFAKQLQLHQDFLESNPRRVDTKCAQSYLKARFVEEIEDHDSDLVESFSSEDESDHLKDEQEEDEEEDGKKEVEQPEESPMSRKGSLSKQRQSMKKPTPKERPKQPKKHKVLIDLTQDDDPVSFQVKREEILQAVLVNQQLFEPSPIIKHRLYLLIDRVLANIKNLELRGATKDYLFTQAAVLCKFNPMNNWGMQNASLMVRVLNIAHGRMHHENVSQSVSDWIKNIRRNEDRGLRFMEQAPLDPFRTLRHENPIPTLGTRARPANNPEVEETEPEKKKKKSSRRE